MPGSTMTDIHHAVQQKMSAAKPFEFHGWRIEGLLRPGAAHKPRVMLGRRGDRRCVIKDLSRMSPIFRALVGRRLLSREARALEHLHDFAATPKLEERIGRDAIAIEFVNAGYLRKDVKQSRKPAVLKSFKETVDALHGQGVVHLDLRQRKNVLVLDDDRVMLVDFESAWIAGTSRFARWIKGWLGSIDRNAVLKWRAKFTPELLSEADLKRIRSFEQWRRLWFFRGLFRAIRRWVADDRKKRPFKLREP